MTARLFLTKMPRFMEEMFPVKTSNVKRLIEHGFMNLNGVVNNIDGPIDDLSITLYEFTKAPVRDYMDLWISGISDPVTGDKTYHGAIASGMEFKPENHGMNMYFVCYDAHGKVEFSCEFTDLCIQKFSINGEKNDAMPQLITINFSGQVKQSTPEVNKEIERITKKADEFQRQLAKDAGYLQN